MAAEPARAGTSGIQSVDRAVTVLEILARRGETGVSEVALELGVHKSTAFRLLGSLEGRGLVEQSADRGKYRLGFGILRLAGALSRRLDVTDHGRPVCERLALELGETVNLAVAQSRHVVNLDQVRGPMAVTTHNWVGQPTPLHATSSGKVLLAWLPAAQVREQVGVGPLAAFTDRTIVDPDRLAEDLALTRDRGYAVTVEEYEIGLNAIAAPVRGPDGSVVAAVSASGPAYRFTADRLDEAAPALVRGAAEISERLGHLA